MTIAGITYTITATHVSGGTRELEPVNNDLVWSGTREGDTVFIRASLESGLELTDSDYEYIDAIQAGADRCEPINVTIEARFEGADYSLPAGYISAITGEFVPRDCKVEIPVQLNDNYTCVYDNWETESNILEATVKIIAYVLVGELQVQSVSGAIPPGTVNTSPPWPGSAIPLAGDGWQPLRQRYVTGSNVSQTTYVREYFEGTQPPGQGWINIGGPAWVREPLFLQSFTVVQDENTASGYEYSAFRHVIGADIVVADEAGSDYEILTGLDAGSLYWKKIGYPNGVKLSSALTKLNPCTDKTFKSNLLRINPDSPLPTDDPYPAAEDGFDELVVWQKSQVKRPLAEDYETTAKWTFKKLYEALQTMFLIDLEATDTELILEHRTVYNTLQGLDLTGTAYADYTQDLTTFNFENAAIPRQEQFRQMDEQVSDDFTEDIDYDNTCATEGPEEIRLNDVTTDFATAAEDDDRVSDQGFFIGACYIWFGVYYLNFENGIINRHLGFPQLIENYLKWERPFIEGEIDSVATTFESAIKIKEQEELKIPMSPAEFATFDPAKLVKTQYGWGEIAAFSWSAATCTLTVTVKHDL
ncbi:MAG: hypothetical protein KDD62_00320 [Bdellovibrionales bacterium]|nr:hypothetical protein [Bdellovibrionales bacterium]